MPKTKKSKKTTDNMEKPQHQTTRREVLKKAIFVAPVILTLPALPSFASAGSQPGDDNTTGPTNVGGVGQDPTGPTDVGGRWRGDEPGRKRAGQYPTGPNR
jgi:hypothetical protein